MTDFGPVSALYHLFLTVSRFNHCLRIVPSFSDCWQVLALFEYGSIFFGWWQVFALFQYCTIFFWLVTSFGSVWVLYHFFLTGDRFWHCLSIVPSFSDWWQVLALFEYCTIFFWLVTGLFYLRIAPSLWTVDRFWNYLSILHLFLAGDRFLHCFSIVTSFSD